MLRSLLPTPHLSLRSTGQQWRNPTHLRFLHDPTSKPSDPSRSSSLTISYLTNSCGFSHAAALSASKKLLLKSTANPDSILSLLKSYHFAPTHIADLVARYPTVLSANPAKTIKPKLDFFLAAGFAPADVCRLVLSNPLLLGTSLERRIKPNFGLLSAIFGTNHGVAVAVRRHSWLLRNNLETCFVPSVEALGSQGVPRETIIKLATLYPRALMSSARAKETVESLEKMGVSPSSKATFAAGFNVLSGLTRATWERKVAFYRGLGWSEKEVVSAFAMQPNIMLRSEERVRRMMDFFAKKLRWEPSFVSARPKVLCHSLEKRIIPRCAVLSVLTLKGLLKTDSVSKPSYLLLSDKLFLRNYVSKYADQVPEVLEAYKGNLDS